MATFITFVKFVIFTACKGGPLVLLYVLPCCLLTNLVNLQHFPDLSNLPIICHLQWGPFCPVIIIIVLSCCLLTILVKFSHICQVFVKFVIFTACERGLRALVLLCVLPCCLLRNLARLPHLSNLSYSPPAKGALLSCYMNFLVPCLWIWWVFHSCQIC